MSRRGRRGSSVFDVDIRSLALTHPPVAESTDTSSVLVKWTDPKVISRLPASAEDGSTGDRSPCHLQHARVIEVDQTGLGLTPLCTGKYFYCSVLSDSTRKNRPNVYLRDFMLLVRLTERTVSELIGLTP